jgi:hypothetical protein
VGRLWLAGVCLCLFACAQGGDAPITTDDAGIEREAGVVSDGEVIDASLDDGGSTSSDASGEDQRVLVIDTGVDAGFVEVGPRADAGFVVQGGLSTTGPAAGLVVPGGLQLLEGGFELGATSCSGNICVTGGIGP